MWNDWSVLLAVGLGVLWDGIKLLDLRILTAISSVGLRRFGSWRAAYLLGVFPFQLTFRTRKSLHLYLLKLFLFPFIALSRAHCLTSCFFQLFSTGNGEEIISKSVNGKQIVTLNRPKALNSLNLSMVRKLYPMLQVRGGVFISFVFLVYRRKYFEVVTSWATRRFTLFVGCFCDWDCILCFAQ